MSALRPRAYAVDDQVAWADREAGVWRLGTVTGLGPTGVVLVRFEDGDARVADPDDRRLVPEAEVPLDERHWLPQQVRDQLARQEAARRLRALCAALHPDGYPMTRANLDALAVDVGNVLFDDEPGDYAAIAAALLAPAPADEPAPTPEAEPCPCCLGNPREVCDACGDHACWAGRLMCDMASGAGTRIAPTP